jgi:hypothetical protein
MTDSNSTLVSTKETDYLDEDKPIRGQNFALLSFISPEDVLVNKEVYYFNKFLENFGKDMKTLLDGIAAKYPESKDLVDTVHQNHSYIFDPKDLNEQYNFFKSVNYNEIESNFHRDNNFVTSMRGIKVRGVFDTLEEAKNRSEFLKRVDNKFNIFIGQVGCWCPWSPNPDALENQEYAETQLNTLMKEYKKNMEEKDVVFEKRKQAHIDNKETTSVIHDMSEIQKSIEEVDAWSARKLNKVSEDEVTDSNVLPTDAVTPDAVTPDAVTPDADVPKAE